jgi:hypothetical protein
MQKRMFMIFSLLLSALIVGCPSSAPPPTTNPISFFVHTEFFPLVGPLQTVPGVTTNWSNPRDVTGGNTPQGDTGPFTVTTDGTGLATVLNKRVPAIWFVIWVKGSVPAPSPGECLGDANDFPVNPQRTSEVICFEVAGPPLSTSTTQGNAFTFLPRPLYTDGSAGNVAKISGGGFSSQYGMPRVEYFDSTGAVISQADATAVASDGSWISAPIPNLSEVIAGSYVGIVFNASANGGYTFAGTTSVDVLDPPDPSTFCGGSGSRKLNCN